MRALYWGDLCRVFNAAIVLEGAAECVVMEKEEAHLRSKMRLRSTKYEMWSPSSEGTDEGFGIHWRCDAWALLL